MKTGSNTICLYCNNNFVTTAPNQKFCSAKCRYKHKYYNKRKQDPNYISRSQIYHQNYYQQHKSDYQKRAKQFQQTDKYKQYITNLRLSGKEAWRTIVRRCGHWKYYKNIECKLTKKEFLDIYFSTDYCAICGQKLNDKNRNSANGRTIDRINPKGHYEKNNIRIICRKCNCKKAHVRITIGIKSGVFRILLVHHLVMLQECAKHCDYLVLLTNNDEYIKEKKGIVPIRLQDRLEILQGIKYVDEVGSFDGPSEEDWIKNFKENRLYKEFGKDAKLIVFHSSELKGQEHVPGQGIVDEVIFIDHIKSESTSQVIERIKKG